MANTQSLWSNERAIPRKWGAMDVDGMSLMNAKLDALTRRIGKMSLNAISPTLVSSCEFYYGGHPTIKCQQMQELSMKSMNYMDNFNKGQQQNNVMGNTYNPSWRNHPKFSWSNQGNNQLRSQGLPGFTRNKC